VSYIIIGILQRILYTILLAVLPQNGSFFYEAQFAGLATRGAGAAKCIPNCNYCQ
jgi:hypothetical protein